jgi:hypothetical protein
MMEKDETAVAGSAAPAKKPYETPQLVSYGNLRDIAQAVGHLGALDGARHSLKTQ